MWKNTTSTACYIERTCDGKACVDENSCTDNDCGVNDVCKNVSGTQRANNLGQYQVYQNGECWNSTTGACGGLIYSPYASASVTPSTANLCVSAANLTNSSISFLPNQPAGTVGTWNWTCNTTNGGTIAPPTCSVRMCEGTECQSQSTGIIRYANVKPAIVSKASDSCTLTWETTNDPDIESNDLTVCTLNGSVVADDNISGTSINPGSHTLVCADGANFQSKTVKCSVKPSYREF